MSPRVVALGASLDGVAALVRLIGGLPGDFPAPVLVTQHAGPDGLGDLVGLLGAASRLEAVQPSGATPIEAGRIYIAPADRHLLVTRGGVVISKGPRENLARPAIDPMFRSAALAYGPGVIGVVLTGELDDGTAGLLAIKDRGGVAVVQDPAEAAAPSMPLSALRHVAVDHCCDLGTMAGLLTKLAGEPPGGEPSGVADAVMAVENVIAAGNITYSDWMRLEHLVARSDLHCPACRSELYELPDRRLLRFRCRCGHAFSPLSLLRAQAEVRRTLVGTFAEALGEDLAFARRLQAVPAYAGEAHMARGLAAHVADLESHAATLGDWQHRHGLIADPVDRRLIG